MSSVWYLANAHQKKNTLVVYVITTMSSKIDYYWSIVILETWVIKLRATY